MQGRHVPSELTEAAEQMALIKFAEGRTPWIWHKDVRHFVIDHYGFCGVDEVYHLAVEMFGSDAPSRSAIGRFYKAVTDHIRRNAANGPL